MKLVMCVECGTFVQARETEDGVEPIPDACPECGETSFRETETEQGTGTDQDASARSE